MANFPYTWLNVNDSAAGDLFAGISAVDASLVLKAGQGIKFPASDFLVRIDDEWIHVATRTTDTFSSLTRGYDGSTAAVHAANAVVFQSAGRSLFQRIYDQIIGHTHPKADIPDFAHNHAQGDVTSLVTDLAGKEPANANIQAHVLSAHAPANAQANADITKAEIEAKLIGTISSHSHAGGSAAWGGITGTLSTQTDLQGALDAKSASTHNHDAAYEATGAVATHAAAADPHTGYQLEAEKGAANGYASLDAGGKVPSAQLPAAGSDPWTYVVLGSDFTTSSATAVNVTGLSFAPAANTRYEFRAVLRTRTATATVGPRPGVSWPTGGADGVAFIRQTSAAGSIVMQNGNINAAVLAPVGGLPNTTQSYPAQIEGEIAMGATPSGAVQVQLASETAGTNVTIKAGSFLRYRAF